MEKKEKKRENGIDGRKSNRRKMQERIDEKIFNVGGAKGNKRKMTLKMLGKKGKIIVRKNISEAK